MNYRRSCHYAVVKWNISSKYLDIKRKRALNLYQTSIDVLLQSLFISPRGTWTLIDSDNRIEPPSDTIFITCMATRGGGGGGGGGLSVERIWWVNGKELCLIWDGSCCSVCLHHAVNLPPNVWSAASEESDRHCPPHSVNKERFTWSRTSGAHRGCRLWCKLTHWAH